MCAVYVSVCDLNVVCDSVREMRSVCDNIRDLFWGVTVYVTCMWCVPGVDGNAARERGGRRPEHLHQGLLQGPEQLQSSARGVVRTHSALDVTCCLRHPL